MKHLFSKTFLIFIIMMGVCMSVAAKTYDFKIENNGVMIYYQILKGEESTVQVVRKKDSYDHNTYSGNVVIPSSVQYKGVDYKVTRIAMSAFDYCKQLTSVELPQSLLSIGWWSFSDCIGLTSITIPSSVTSIGQGAFRGCIGLVSINIPKSVTKIENEAFKRCRQLKDVVIENSESKLGKDVFMETPYLAIYNQQQAEAKQRAEEEASRQKLLAQQLAKQKEAEQIEAARKRKEAEDAYYFEYGHPYKYNGINYKLISETDNTIRVTYEYEDGRNDKGNQLYRSDYSGDIVIPPTIEINGKSYTVKEIGEQAFRSSKVTSVQLPNTIKSIRYGAFAKASYLGRINIPNSVVEIEDYAFSQSGVKDVVLSNSVKALGDFIFYECYDLTSVALPNQCKELSDYTFAECKKLQSVTLPSSLTKIGKSVFYDCVGLLSLTLPTTITSIGEYAFYGCKNLSIKNLPRNAKYQQYTFCKCKHQYALIKQKYTPKYGAAIVNKIVNIFENPTFLYAQLIDIPLGAPLVVIQESMAVMYPDNTAWKVPHSEDNISGRLYQSFWVGDYVFEFTNGKLTRKADYN